MTFSHLKKKKIVMVDISNKKLTKRVAKAKCVIKFSDSAFNEILNNNMEKGDIFNTARCAGIVASKKTAELIPLCHNISLSSVDIDFKIDKKKNIIEVLSTVKTKYATGVEMEALVACSISSLTIYDMCKSLDKGITIEKQSLIYKSGGKSGTFKND
jgi:cyclic pyranopterin phosphate synthase